MSHGQKALIRYWLVIVIGMAITIKLTDLIPIRLLIVPALLLAAFVDKIMRPTSPDDVPSPLEIIQSSKLWQVCLGIIAIGAVATAVLSATIHSLGLLLSQNSWMVFPMLFITIAGPIIQSQIVLFRALGDQYQ